MVEIDERFESLDAWLNWARAHPFVFSRDEGALVGKRIAEQGFSHPLTGERVAAESILVGNSALREGLFARGLNSRQRAVVELIAEELHATGNPTPRIFATEAVTPFALLLRGIYPYFLGSEYGASPEARQALFPIQHQDLQSLTFADGVFDVVTTNEVLEHVPDIDVALAEIARVLRPGGWHIGTVPFRFMEAAGDLRARLEDGQLLHLKEPEYHGNPVDPENGALVFETPAWNLIARARASGFGDAHMRFVASESRGYVSEQTGLFIFCAQK